MKKDDVKILKKFLENEAKKFFREFLAENPKAMEIKTQLDLQCAAGKAVDKFFEYGFQAGFMCCANGLAERKIK